LRLAQISLVVKRKKLNFDKRNVRENAVSKKHVSFPGKNVFEPERQRLEKFSRAIFFHEEQKSKKIFPRGEKIVDSNRGFGEWTVDVSCARV
jgi:hypothetical protein